MALRAIGFALAVLTLAPGCAMLRQTPAGAVLTGLFPGKKDGAGSTVAAIPRATIEQAGMPVMRVVIPSYNGDALIALHDTKPSIATYASGDGLRVTFRNNVLIETRGLGADLMSSAAPSAGQIASGGSHKRTYFLVGPEDSVLRQDFSCRVENRGPAVLSIYGRTHSTRHVAEVCSGADGQFTNDYWFEGGTIRKSREWIGAAVGHLEFDRVVD